MVVVSMTSLAAAIAMKENDRPAMKRRMQVGRSFDVALLIMSVDVGLPSQVVGGCAAIST